MLIGRTLVGVGTSDQTFNAGQTGGESNHTLTVAEMPSHKHTIRANIPYAFSEEEMISGKWNYLAAMKGSSWTEGLYGTYSGDEEGTGTLFSGNSQSHNNLQPYITVYMYQRIS